MKLTMARTKTVISRSILGVVRPDSAGLSPATHSRRRRPPVGRPRTTRPPNSAIPARCRPGPVPDRGPAGAACARPRFASHRPARRPRVSPARRGTCANAAHAPPARLLYPQHHRPAKLTGHFEPICLSLRANLHSRARRARTRAWHSKNKRHVGFPEVVGISFYVPWLLRTTTTKISSIESS